MSDIAKMLTALAPDHRRALQWFHDRRDTVVPWPAPLDGGLFLVNKAKGIHKPAGWRHALSVRETLGGPYADRPVETRPDGSWRYDYFQEGADPAHRDAAATNRGLVACQLEGVPVAVLHQVKAKPGVQYKILGLARVAGWANGYFSLEGYAYEATRAVPPVASPDLAPASPVSLEDHRRRIDASIVVRQGSGAFRDLVLKGYAQRCAVTDCDVVDALEAAHIIPYLGTHTDRLENAVLLRADVHTLFDHDLVTIDPATLRIQLAAALRTSAYAPLHGAPLRLPAGVDAAAIREGFVRRAALIRSG